MVEASVELLGVPRLVILKPPILRIPARVPPKVLKVRAKTS